MNYKKIGIVIADRDEYHPFVKMIADAKQIKVFNMQGISFKMGESDVSVLLCGIGKVNAATAATALVSAGCEAILNFGLSGGLGNSKKGGFCLPDTFLEHDFDFTDLGYKPCEKPWQEYIYKADKDLLALFSKTLGVKPGGTAVTGDSFICDEQKSKELSDNFSASSCDMETAAIASVCYAAGVPFAVLRRISDDAGDDAIDTYRDVNTNEGDVLGNAFLKCLKAVTNAEG